MKKDPFNSAWFYYSQMLLPVVGQLIIWLGLDAISPFHDRMIMASGMIITCGMWIMAVVIKEIKNELRNNKNNPSSN